MWQSLIRNWLMRTAKERLYEEMARRAQDQAADHDAPSHEEVESGAASTEETTDESATPRQRPCDVGIVFALAIERGPMEDRLDGALRIRADGLAARQGGLHGRHVVLVDSGVGRAKAAHATELLIAGHRPAWVISAGLAGGLAEGLRRGDIVMADSVADESGRTLAIDLHIDADELAKHPRLHVGRMLTIDRLAMTPDEKRTLGERHQALACECESFAVAEACRAAETRFLAIRAILDPVEAALPAEIERLSRPQSGLRKAGGLVGAVWNRPSAAKDLIALQEHSLEVSDRLAKFLEGVVRQLVRV